MNYDEIIARGHYDAVGAEANTLSAQDAKLEKLAIKRAEKAERLGLNVQGSNLDKGTYTVMPGGRVESNSNKIWNKLNAIESQYVLGKVLSDYGLQQDEQGNYTTYDGQPVSPYDARRLYMYGTGRVGDPDTELGTKLGLSTGQASTSDVRYDATVDPRFQDEWRTTDKHSVDLSRKQFDQPLDYRAATILEGLYHGNERLLDQRMYHDVTSDEALQRQSGVSEIYKGGLDNLMGDASNQELTPERIAELDAQIQEYMKLPGAGTKTNTTDFAAVDEKILQEKLENQTFADEIGQTIRGTIGSIPKGAIELADAATGLVSMALTGMYNKVTGSNVERPDLISDENKESFRGFIDELTGYDAKLDEADMARVQQDLEATGIKIADPSTWSKLTEAETWDKIGDAGKKALMNPSMTFAMMGEVVGQGAGLGVATKIGAKVGAKVAPKLTEKVDDLLKTNRTKITEKYADELKSAKGDAKEAIKAKMRKEYNILNKTKDLIKGTTFTNADMMVRINKDIEAYTENNNGEGPDALKLGQIVILNRLASSMEVGSMKLAFTPTKELTQDVKDNVLKSIAKTTKHLGKSTLAEGAQETFDSVVEIINQQHDTAKYEGKTVADLINDNSAQILTGTVAGAVGGGHMAGLKTVPKTAGKVVGGALKGAKDIAVKSNEKRKENNLKAEMEAQTASRTSSIEAQGIDFDSYGEEQRVEGKDTETVKFENEDGTIEDVKLFEEMDNLRVESKDANEYQSKLEEHKDRVVLSLYKLDDKGEIVGLSEEAEAMTPEELKQRETKVNNWLNKYNKEYTVDMTKELPTVDETVLESVTEKTVQSGNLTEEQANNLNIKTVLNKINNVEWSPAEKAFAEEYEGEFAKTLEEFTSILGDGLNTYASREFAKYTGKDANFYVNQKLEAAKANEEVETDTDTDSNVNENTKPKDSEQSKKDADKKPTQDEIDDATTDNLAKASFKGINVNDLSEPELVKFYESQLANKVRLEDGNGKETFRKGWSNEKITRIAKAAAARRQEIKDTYKFDEDVEIQVEYDAIVLKNKGANKKNAKDKVIDSTQITGDDIYSILEGKIEEVMKDKDYDKSNSNFDNRVIKKLGKIEQSLILNKLKDKFDSLLANEEAQKRIAEIFKEGSEKEVLVLLINAMAAIDTATIVDTQQRQRISEDLPSLMKDEYYAGLSGLITQIGKDHMTSRKAMFKGSPANITAEYRKLGQLAVDLLEMADLIEINEGMETVASSKLVTEKNESLVIGGKYGTLPKNVSWNTKPLTDRQTGELILTHKDKGIRLKPEASEDMSTEINGKSNPYTNEVGDVAKRVNKLLLPGNTAVPTNEPANGEIKVDPNVSLYKDDEVDMEEVLQKMRETRFRIKPRMLKMLKGIKARLVKDFDNNLDQMITNDSDLASLIGLDKLDTESEILMANEEGVTNTLKDELRGILDNLEDLEKGFHYDFQVDLNNRWSLREIVANYQSSKSIARQLLTLDDKDGIGYEIGAENLQETIDAMVNELGFKAVHPDNVDAEYEAVAKYVQSNKTNYGSKNSMKDFISKELKYEGEMLEQAVKQFDKIRIALALGINAGKDLDKLSRNIVQVANPNGAMSKFAGKNKIKLMSLIDGLMDIRESNGKNTSYMVERDAKASGVFNTLLNILGYDSSKNSNNQIQTLLEKLGVQFEEGKEVNVIDAYKLLQVQVESVLEEGADGVESALDPIKKNVKELEDLGIDTRELAKPPVMTWFYSAGMQTIVKEFTETVLTQVVRKAIYGDEASLKHIANVLGRESIEPSEVRDMRIADKDYKKLYETYSEIGDLYQKQLDKAFPGVVTAKKAMKDMYDSVVELTHIDGQNWGTDGIIPSAAKALYGNVNSTTNTTGTSTIFQNKEYVQNLTAEDKKKYGLDNDENYNEAFFANKMMANPTSTGPINAQNVDIGQQAEGFRYLFNTITEGNVGGMSVHDAYYGPVKFGKVFKKGYEDSTIALAISYDFINNQLFWAKQSLKSMEARAKVRNVDEATKKELEFKIKRLKKEIAKWEAENKVRVEYKKDKLEGVKTDVLGGLDREVAKNEGVKKTKPEARKENKTFKKEIARAKDGIVIDTETGFSKKDRQPYQIGYTVNGEAKSINIAREPYTTKSYYGEVEYETAKRELKAEGKVTFDDKEIKARLEEKFSEYKTLDEANKLIRSKSAVSLDEAMETILMEDGNISAKPVVGFNSAEFDIKTALQPYMSNEELKAKLGDADNIDIRTLIQDLMMNRLGKVGKELNKGTQSEIARLAGVEMNERDLHDAAGDVQLLQELIQVLDGMDKTELDVFTESLRDVKQSAKDIKKAQVIQEFSKNAFANPNKAVVDLIAGLAGLGNVKAKDIQELITGKEIKWTYKPNDSSRIVLTKSKPTEIVIGKESKEGKFEEQVLEVIGHEVEHMVTVGTIKQASKGESTKEINDAYKFLDKVLNRIDKSKTKGKLARVMSEDSRQKQIAELVAVVRGEQNGGAQIAAELENYGFLTAVADKTIKAIKDMINFVRSRISSGQFDPINEESEMTVENIIAAVEQIHQNDRLTQVDAEMEFDTKQNKGKMTANEIALEAKKVLEECK